MSNLFSWLPYELHIHIFNNLFLCELFYCMNVCRYFEYIIRTHSWHNHTIKLTNPENSFRLLSRYNFQRFKIEDTGFKFSDDLWNILSKKNNVRAKITHITSCFDNYSFEFVKKTKNCYFIFNNNIKIPLPYEFQYISNLVELSGKPDGTIQKILKCIIEDTEPSTRRSISINTSSTVPVHILTLFDSYEIPINHFTNITNVEILKYYLERIPRQATFQLILVYFLGILSKINCTHVLEEMHKVISTHMWIVQYLDHTRPANIFFRPLDISTIAEIYMTKYKLYNKIINDSDYLPHSTSTQQKFQHLLNEIAVHAKSTTKWKSVKDFCTYHPNYLSELLNYSETTPFLLDDEFIRKIIQKKRYDDIAICISSNTLLNPQFTRIKQHLISKTNKIYLPDRKLFCHYKKQLIRGKILNDDTRVYNWLLQNYQSRCFLKFYNKSTQIIDLTQLLLSNNASLAQSIIDNGIRHVCTPNLPQIKQLVKNGDIFTLNFLFKHELLPNKKIFEVGLNMDRLIWLAKNFHFVSISDKIYFNYITYNNNIYGCHLCLKNLQYDENKIVLLLKWIYMRNLNMPANYILHIFCQGIKYFNLNLLRTIHRHYKHCRTQIRSAISTLNKDISLGMTDSQTKKSYQRQDVGKWLYRKGYIKYSW